MSRQCFVIMPFAAEFDGIWKHVIQPTVQQHGDHCFRGDDIFAPGAVIADVIESIEKADYLIADISERNANVYYELGFAHALNKPVILVSRSPSTVPFDIQNQRYITYTDTAAGAVQLTQDLLKYLHNT